MMAVVDPRVAALSVELVDLITEAVARPHTAAGRAEVVAAVLVRALDAVTWRQGPGGEPIEQSSLLRVVEAAVAHHERMAAAAPGAADPVGPAQRAGLTVAGTAR